MSYTDKKITQAEINAHHVQGATDYLIGNAQQNKAVFDNLPEFIAGKFNDLIDEVAGQHGDEIKVAVDEWLAEHPEVTTTVQDNSLTTAKYVDGSVTEPKIAAGAVTPSKLDRAYSTTTDLASVNETLTNELNVLDARMDEFASLPEGSTSGDAELADIRVGVDGKTYPSAGGAVRGQVADLKSDLDAFESETVETVVTSTNILNPSVYFTGAIGSDGNLMTNGNYANYKTSDFIELEENTDYYFAVYANNAEHTIATNRKLLLLYDSSKQSISGTHQNAEGAQLTFNTSTNVKYVRVSCDSDISTLQLAKGTTAGQFVAYADRKDLLINLGDVPMAQVQDIINNSGIITYEADKNLANPDTMTVGAIQSNGTVATNGAWALYKTTDYIEIEEGTDYVASQWSNQMIIASGRMMLLLFDSNKAPISNTYQNVDAVTNLTFSNASARYVRVSARDYQILQVETGSTPSSFEAFNGKYVMGYPLGNVPLNQVNGLHGKKWAVCGDSFTNGATENRLTEGKYKGQRIVYPYIIGNHNEMEIVRHFTGGQTLANPADGTFTNSLTNSNNPLYYQNIPADADYITIYLGINDENHYRGWSPDGESTSGYIELGTIDDATSATYYGAWNEVLTWLITNRPFAHIGIIVCNGLGASEYQGVSGRDWRDAQIAIAEKYGVPYIDLNGDKQTPAMIRSVNPKLASNIKTVIDQKQAVDYPSNTHPNDDAHLFESTFIESFLKSI